LLLAPVVETDDGYLIPINVQVVGNPVRLTASLARSAGGLLLAYTDQKVSGPRAELAAALSGLGVLLLSSAHLYLKGCGGVKLLRGTDLDVQDVAFAHALFMHMHEHSAWQAKKSLAPTQDEALGECLAFLKDQSELIAKLKQAPEVLASGAFAFEEKRSLLGKWFAPKQAAAPQHVRATRTAEEEARIMEARQLVEEVGLFSE
jgi:hypothetical protein